MKYSTLSIMIAISMSASSAYAMNALNDTELSQETGQALFSLGYIPDGGTNPNASIGFYQLGLQAQIDLNANIKNLRLGCDTPASTGTACDVDIDNMSFTGIVPTGVTNGTSKGPTSDFTLNNPFFQIAVKNPTSASTRQIVGFRFGAESAWGMLSLGNNTDGVGNTVGTNTGINSISGHLPTILDNGIVPTHICTFSANDPTGCGFGGELTSTNSTINVDTPNAGDNRFDLTLKRANRAQLNGIQVVSLLNLTINSNLDQSTIFIHNIAVGQDSNSNGKYDAGEGVNNFAISTQSQDVKWLTGGKWLNAQKGWWMELPESRIENFTTRDVYATLGAVFGLNLKDLNQRQLPVINCYGTAYKYC